MPEFVSFYPDFDPRHPFFQLFERTGLRVGSLFGDSPLVFDVLYSGECVTTLRHDGRHFTWQGRERWVSQATGRAHWFFGTPRIDHPQALHVPHYFDYWARYLHDPARMRSLATRTPKEFGISFLVSNITDGTLAQRRLSLAVELAQWFPVHAPERLRPHFPTGSKARFHDVPDKLDFVARYQFNLCFENSVLPGYLTEKPFDALVTGAVPLYEGDPLIGEWFHPGSHIDCTGLDAAAIATRIEEARQPGGVMEHIEAKRETLSRVTCGEMMARLSDFARAVTADRDRPMQRVRKWVAKTTGI